MHLLELDPEVFFFIGEPNITYRTMSLMLGDAAEQERKRKRGPLTRCGGSVQTSVQNTFGFESFKSTSKNYRKNINGFDFLYRIQWCKRKYNIMAFFTVHLAQ